MKIKELFENTANVSEIKQWISNWNNATIEQSKIEADGSVSFDCSIAIKADHLNANGEIPFKLNTVDTIRIVDTKFSSFKNFPSTLMCSHEGLESTTWAIDFRQTFGNKLKFDKVTSLEGITPVIKAGGVNLRYCPNINYSKVNNYLKEVRPAITINEHYKGPLLSFLKIKTLQWVFSYATEDEPLSRAVEIINKHLESGRDILACQEELIDAGLNEYAKL